METIYVKPNGRIGGFSQGNVYKVLAISVDNNGQPVFSVADDELNIKNIPAERFKYSPGGPDTQQQQQVEVDYEVIDDDGDVEIDLHDDEVPEEEILSEDEEEKPKKAPEKPKTQAKKGRPKKNTK